MGALLLAVALTGLFLGLAHQSQAGSSGAVSSESPGGPGSAEARVAASGARSVPRLQSTAPMELRPGYPGYDPIRIGAVLSQGAIFAQEPRVAAWAERIEKVLHRDIPADLSRIVPGFELAGIECRTTICRVSWQPPDQAADEKIHVLLRVLFSGSGAGGVASEPHAIYLTFAGGILRDVRTGDAAILLPKLQELRRQRLMGIRRQLALGYQTYAAVAASEWPDQ